MLPICRSVSVCLYDIFLPVCVGTSSDLFTCLYIDLYIFYLYTFRNLCIYIHIFV